ncbi:MAG: hypothetical protein ACFFG0_15540 [Candidatus Thorarchaeota archaeon]
MVYQFEKNESLKYIVIWKQTNTFVIGQVRFTNKKDAIDFATNLGVKANVYLIRTMEKICY